LVGWASTRRTSPEWRLPDPEEMLLELRDLAASAGAEVVGSTLQRTPEPDAATLIGKGKVEEVRAEATAAEADLVIFDHDLSPTQLRNLERLLELKILDRTQLILDIFARRARTREGQLQVELAQLNYLLPRLTGRGTALSRLGGGIGTRGPGEQQLEFDRRRIRGRIRKLEEAIEHVRTQRALHRARRRDQKFLTVALVGYTNAGKSTLFNAMTRAEVMTSSRLFATLDPTVRALPLASRQPVLLSDTVGFIRKLPSHLVAAFRATLEEVKEADLLVHVTDASHPDHAAQDEAVESMLESLDVVSKPRIHVWNKSDLLPARGPGRHAAGAPSRSEERTHTDVWVSARTGEGLDALKELIDAMIQDDPLVEAQFELDVSDGARLALLHRQGTVLSTRFNADCVIVNARVTASLRDRIHGECSHPTKRKTS
jgi:GTP-binding protein HflX